MSSPSPVVAIFNSNQDVVEVLRAALEQAGLVCVSAHVDDAKRGEGSLGDFMREHDPSVVVFDLVPPYERSWRFLVHLRSMPIMQRRQFVVTSTNAKRASELSAASEEIHEVIGKPYDIDHIVTAVKEATRARPTRDQE